MLTAKYHCSHLLSLVFASPPIVSYPLSHLIIFLFNVISSSPQVTLALVRQHTVVEAVVDTCLAGISHVSVSCL